MLLSFQEGGGQDGHLILVPCTCSILVQTAAYFPAAWSAIMEGSGLLEFLVGLFGGLLGCLLVFLMQRPGTPKQEMGASDEAEDSKDRIQAAPAQGDGQAVTGTQGRRSRTPRPQPRPRRWTETPKSRMQPSRRETGKDVLRLQVLLG